MTIEERLAECGLNDDADVAALVELRPSVAEDLAAALVGEQPKHAQLCRRLAMAHPRAFDSVLAKLDPTGAAACAFDGAPWESVQHWVAELKAHRAKTPTTEDALGAALLALGRCGHERALHSIESWLSSTNRDQLQTARELLAPAGLGVARGRRAIPLWPIEPRQLLPADTSEPRGVRREAEELATSCSTCSGRLRCLASIDAGLLGDLGIRAEVLRIATCPRCVLSSQPYYVVLDKDRVRSCPAEVQPRSSGPRPRQGLRVPAVAAEQRLSPTTRYADARASDRARLSRLGGAPTPLQQPLHMVSPDAGEPMMFVAQLFLEDEDALLYAFYCSEDGVLGTVLQRTQS